MADACLPGQMVGTLDGLIARVVGADGIAWACGLLSPVQRAWLLDGISTWVTAGIFVRLGN